MQPVFPFRPVRITIPMFAVLATTLGLAGCGGDEPPAETAEEQDRPAMVERQAPRRQAAAEPATGNASPEEDFRVIPKLEPGTEEEGMGLDLIIDASSKKAYAESLRWIAQDASREQLANLERSVRYIHMYDPAVMGREERMLQVIDGKTGNEIIARASKIAQERRGGR